MLAVEVKTYRFYQRVMTVTAKVFYGKKSFDRTVKYKFNVINRYIIFIGVIMREKSNKIP